MYRHWGCIDDNMHDTSVNVPGGGGGCSGKGCTGGGGAEGTLLQLRWGRGRKGRAGFGWAVEFVPHAVYKLLENMPMPWEQVGQQRETERLCNYFARALQGPFKSRRRNVCRGGRMGSWT